MERPGPGEERWFDQEAGPVVRPYAVTKGRARPSGTTLDLIDVVAAAGQPAIDERWLGPEHRLLLAMCRDPVCVADLTASTELPLGVVRVLLADLYEYGLIAIAKTPRSGAPDVRLLKNVLDGLRAL
jgi:Protein of unknown function (DUF742)